MKLSIFDRILLAILLIAAILTAFVLFAVASNLLPEDGVGAFVHLFYGVPQNQWILAGSGLLLLLISVRLLFAGKREKVERQPSSAVMRRNENGGMFISLSAIDGMVERHCLKTKGVSACKTSLKQSEDGVTIGVRLVTSENANIVAITEGLQKSLKTYLEANTGIHIKEIGVLVEKTEPGGEYIPAPEPETVAEPVFTSAGELTDGIAEEASESEEA